MFAALIFGILLMLFPGLISISNFKMIFFLFTSFINLNFTQIKIRTAELSLQHLQVQTAITLTIQ